MASAPSTHAIHLLLYASVLGAAGLGAAVAGEPKVEQIGQHPEGVCLLASSAQAPCLLTFGEAPFLRWLPSKTPSSVASSRLAWSLAGRPVAATALTESTLAVVVASPDGVATGPRLAFIRCDVVGRFEASQEVPLPDAADSPEGDTGWSLAATSRHLFLGGGSQVWRIRHTSGGLSEPKPYTRLDAPVRGMAVDGKGYLAVLAAEDDQSSKLLYFDPTPKSAAPLADYALPLPGARQLGFARAKGDASPRLYVSSPAGLHGIGLSVGPRGRVAASPTLVWRPPAPIESLAGAPAEGKGAGPLYALADGVLHKITPQPEE